MSGVFRDTQVKRQLAIDCGQKGFWHISYCHCASSIDLKGEINVLQDCFCLFVYLFSVPWQVARVDLERRVDFLRVVVLLRTGTSLKKKKNSSMSAGLFSLQDTNQLKKKNRPGGSLSITEKSVEGHCCQFHCELPPQDPRSFQAS